MKHTEEAESQPSRHSKPKSREVSSRFLSPTPLGNEVNSPAASNAVSPPLRQRSAGRLSVDGRRHQSPANSRLRGLWPSAAATTTTTAQQSSESKHGTLAECFRNERRMERNHSDKYEKTEKLMNPIALNRYKTFSEKNRSEDDKKISKENHKTLFGGSMRYTGKFKFPGKSSSSSSTSPSSSSKSTKSDDSIIPGRLSVDETSLRTRSSGRKSDYMADIVVDSESDQSDVHSGTSFGSSGIGKSLPASYMAPTMSSRMSGIEVSSKYLQDSSVRSRRGSSDSINVQKPNSAEDSPKKLTLKSALKRSNSTKTSAVEASRWGESPEVRSSSPTVAEESKAGKGMSKPPTSPSKVKGVGNLLNIGLEFLKGKKSNPSVSSPLGLGIGESVHQLRVFHTRLVQWRYANARAETVDRSIAKEAQRNTMTAWDGLERLRNSVRQKKLQLEKEKREMKLNHILQSQLKSLGAWGAMERQHQSGITVINERLQAIVCRVPLGEGAKGDPQLLSLIFRKVSDISETIKVMQSKYTPMAQETATTSKELAEIVKQEKLLLEECLEHFKLFSALESQEASLKCNLMQIKLQLEQQQQKQHIKKFLYDFKPNVNSLANLLDSPYGDSLHQEHSSNRKKENF